MLHFIIRDKYKSRKNSISIIEYYIKNSKINKDFMITLDQLSLEEILLLKIESLSSIFNGKAFPFVYKNFIETCKRSLLIAMISAFPSITDITSLLGIHTLKLKKIAFDILLKEKEILFISEEQHKEAIDYINHWFKYGLKRLHS